LARVASSFASSSAVYSRTVLAASLQVPEHRKHV
jgi:hypothetical protein